MNLLLRYHRHLTYEFTFEWSIKRLKNGMQNESVCRLYMYLMYHVCIWLIIWIHKYISSIIHFTSRHIKVLRFKYSSITVPVQVRLSKILDPHFARSNPQRLSQPPLSPNPFYHLTCNFSDSLTIKLSFFVSGEWTDFEVKRIAVFLFRATRNDETRYDVKISFDERLRSSIRRWVLADTNMPTMIPRRG